MSKRKTSGRGGRLKRWGKVHDAFNCNSEKGGEEERARRKGLAARNFQSAFLPRAKQELGGEAWKRSWEQYAEKTQGLPLSLQEKTPLLHCKGSAEQLSGSAPACLLRPAALLRGKAQAHRE